MNQEDVIKELNEQIEKLKEEKFYLNYKLERERYYQLKIDIKNRISDTLEVPWNRELDQCIDEILEVVGDYVFDNHEIILTNYQNQFKNPAIREMCKEDE